MKQQKQKKSSGNRIRVHASWVFHYDGIGCDGCNAEYLACLSPGWDIQRLGFRNTGNPAYADILLVTGLIDAQGRRELLEIYHQMPAGSKVIAAGACACTGGIFAVSDGIAEGADSILPVDFYLPGCAVRPEGLIDALLAARDFSVEPEEPAEEAGDEQ